jgi:hypothetical protein
MAVAVAFCGASIAKAEPTSERSLSGKLTVTPAVLTQSDDQSTSVTPVQYRRAYRNYYRNYSRPSWGYSYPYRSYYSPRYSYGYYGYPRYGYSSYYRPYYNYGYYPRYYTGYRGFSYSSPGFYGSFYW